MLRAISRTVPSIAHLMVNVKRATKDTTLSKIDASLAAQPLPKHQNTFFLTEDALMLT